MCKSETDLLMLRGTLAEIQQRLEEFDAKPLELKGLDHLQAELLSRFVDLRNKGMDIEPKTFIKMYLTALNEDFLRVCQAAVIIQRMFG